MTPQELAAELDALTDVRDDVQDTIIDELEAALAALDVFDEDAVLDWTREAAMTVRDGQDLVADVASEVAANLAEDMGYEPASSRPLSDYPRNTNPLTVYQRPAEQGRYQAVTQREGDFARTRLENLVSSDIALAQREAMHGTLRNAGVLYYRRIVHPELSRTGSCGLCIVASTRVYRIEDLMPLHDRCRCSVAPVRQGEDDPGRSLNRSELDRLYEEAGGNSAQELNRVRVTTEQHGELGPILVRQQEDGQDVWVRSTTRDSWRSQKRPKYARQELEKLRARLRGQTSIPMTDIERRWTVDRIAEIETLLEGG